MRFRKNHQRYDSRWGGRRYGNRYSGHWGGWRYGSRYSGQWYNGYQPYGDVQDNDIQNAGLFSKIIGKLSSFGISIKSKLKHAPPVKVVDLSYDDCCHSGSYILSKCKGGG